MAELYLNSGESIVLTTHKVSVSHVLYDMMLTTRRLILVESGYTRFEPRAIPFLNIESVSAGKIATGEPVITLSTRDPGSTGTPEQVNLIFSEQPGERRRRERDEWLRKLMGYIVSEREQAAGTDIPPVDAAPKLFPIGATPRPVDIALPHKTVGGHSDEPDEIVVMPDQPDPPDDPAEKEGAPDPFTRAARAIKGSGDVSRDRTAPATLARSIPDTPAGEEPAALQKEEAGLPQTTPPRTMEPTARGGKEPPAAEAAQESQKSPPPPSRDWRRAAIAGTAIIIVILAVMVGAFLSVHYGTEKNVVPDGPIATPAPTVQPTPGPPPVIIPTEGVWVRVEYNGTFMGVVGDPGFLQHVGGSGNKFYKIGNSDGFVQVSLQKLDYSGETLAAWIYRNGTLVYNRSVRAPKGEILILVNSRTGEQPGVTPSATGKAEKTG